MAAGAPTEDKLSQLKQQLLQALVNRESDDTAWMKIIDGMSNNQVRILKKEVKDELRRRRKNGGVNAHNTSNLLAPRHSATAPQSSQAN